jgi:6-phosphogluconolactonase
MASALAVPGRALPGEQIVCPTAEAAAQTLAARLTGHLRQRLDRVSAVHLALSGGSSATLLGTALAEGGVLTAQEWSRIHVWMVDERCVPDDDPRLNFNLVRDTLLAGTPLPLANLHPMPVLADDGAARYEADLRTALAARTEREKGRLDAVILGMGPDGHTASLFPASPALDEAQRLVVLNDGAHVVLPRPRMTMTYPILNRARLIALLVTGASKKPALERALAGLLDFHDLPILGILPAPGSKQLWCLDQDAAPAGLEPGGTGDVGTTPVSG